MRPSQILASLTLLLLLTPVWNTCRAACPQSGGMSGCDIDGWGWTSSEPGAAEVPNSSGDSVPWQAGSACPAGCYDLRAGLVTAHVYGSPFYPCEEMVNGDDVYQLSDPSSNSAHAFSARLHLTGTISGNGGFISDLIEKTAGGASKSISFGPGAIAVDTTIAINLQHAPGELFELYYSLTCLGNVPDGAVQATAVLQFSDLPAGAYVTSCQGYDLAVPTQATTWGRVKSLYR